MTGRQHSSSTRLDRAFDALRSVRRRYVLHHLVDTGTAETGEVVDRIVEWETGAAGAPRDDERTVELTLRHTHLPKLSDLGAIDYDRRSDTLRYRGGPVLEELLAVAADADLPG